MHEEVMLRIPYDSYVAGLKLVIVDPIILVEVAVPKRSTEAEVLIMD